MHFRLVVVAILLGWSQAVFAEKVGREHHIPLFMPADDPKERQGFLRIINHSNKGGVAHIYGVDDSGSQRGPARLRLEALETIHVNSADVEDGNATKGLTSGLGNGTGNWRLMLYSDEIDIEPLAYIRTLFDGFLTSMHDVASEAAMHHRVPVFNPGRNTNQESWLRIVNLGNAQANVTISGRDDAGEEGSADVTATIGAQGAYSATAKELEDAGLGTGTGKWSLTVSANQPVQVMSLMNTPSGHLSNLSGAKREYRGAVGLWQVSFADGEGGEGYVILLPDSRLYAWLPEADVTRIARGTYNSDAATITGKGVVYESGKIGLEGFAVEGGSDNVTLSAMYRDGDWIRGDYTVAGQPARKFHGWAFAGFERGGSVAQLQGTWGPLGDNPGLPAVFTTNVAGAFDDQITINVGGALGELTCEFAATLAGLNPAFIAFEGMPVINCGLISFDAGQVEMIMSVMDTPDKPGMGTRAIVFAILPNDEQIGLGAVYEKR